MPLELTDYASALSPTPRSSMGCCLSDPGPNFPGSRNTGMANFINTQNMGRTLNTHASFLGASPDLALQAAALRSQANAIRSQDPVTANVLDDQAIQLEEASQMAPSDSSSSGGTLDTVATGVKTGFDLLNKILGGGAKAPPTPPPSAGLSTGAKVGLALAGAATLGTLIAVAVSSSGGRRRR